MNAEATAKIVRDYGIVGALAIFMTVSYVKLTSEIIPLLAKHNHELDELICLAKQILELLRAKTG